MNAIKRFFSSRLRTAIFVAVIIVALIVTSVVVSLRQLKKMSGGIMEEEVNAASVEEQDLSTTVSATGTVESQNVLAVTTELQAKVESLEVGLGDRVEEGDILCTFDKTDIERQIELINSQNSQASALDAQQKNIAKRDLDAAKNSANASILRARQEVEAISMEVNAAKSKLDALKNNPNPNPLELSTAEAEYAEANRALVSANNELQSITEQANANIQSAQDALDTANISSKNDGQSKELGELTSQLDKTVIKATQSGIVTQLSVEKGGIPAGGAIMQIADDKNLRIKIPVGEKDILNLKEGMEARITSDAFEDKEFTGKVSQVINFSTSEGTSQDGTGGSSKDGYSAYVDVDPGSELLLGMSVKVEIVLSEGGKKLAVPYDSIMNDGDGDYVFLASPIENDTKFLIERVDVTTGMSNDYYTEISSGINEGDYVITNPWMVTEGDKVEIGISSEFKLDETEETE